MSGKDKKVSVDGFVTLHIPCQNSYLRIVRQSIANLCVHSGLSEFKSAQLEMAVDEACASVIKNEGGSQAQASADTDHQGLRLNLIQKHDRIEVEMYYFGAGMNFEVDHEVSPDEYGDDSAEEELGLYVIKRFVDDINYEANTPSGNYLKLTKLL